MIRFALAALFVLIAILPARAQDCIEIGRSCVERDAAELSLPLSEAFPDLSVLDNFSDLTALNLRSGLRFDGDVDLAPLRDQTKLERLTIDGLKIDDLGPLDALSNLSLLRVTGLDEPVDMSPISRLTGLTGLSLRGNRWLDDLSFVASLEELEFIDLHTVGARDLAPLSGLVKLRRIDLYNTDVSDLSPLGDMTEMEFLELSYSEVDALDALSRMENLHTIYMLDTRTLSLRGLENASELKKLFANGARLTDISALADKPVLEELELHDTSVEDLTPLSNATGLRTLGFNNTRVTDISALAGLTNITQLRFKQTQINNIGPLASLSNLRDLSLPQQAMDLSVLASMPALQSLRAPDLPEVDMTPILELRNLSTFLPGDARAPLRRNEIAAFIEKREDDG